jgi:SAM-dependent methyltransferase
MAKWQDLWSKIRIFAYVRWFNFSDFWQTVFNYWDNFEFALVDMMLLLSYFYQSPYRIARKFEQTQSQQDQGLVDVAPYGETPLVTLDKIVRVCGVVKEDVVYELGAGRGRSSFWLALYLGCKTIGIEYNPYFVTKAERIRRLFKINNLEFRNQNMLQADLSDATVVYLFGTALDDSQIRALARRLAQLQAETKIITISYPLQDYITTPAFTLLEAFEVEFVWGSTTAYIQEVTKRTT